MERTVLITLNEDNVASRFDLATEVLLTTVGPDGRIGVHKTIVLPHASAEDLCHLILTEKVGAVVCGGIEDEFYQYLTWKKVQVIDSVIGPWQQVVERLASGRLESGDILVDRFGEAGDA